MENIKIFESTEFGKVRIVEAKAKQDAPKVLFAGGKYAYDVFPLRFIAWYEGRLQ